MTGHYSKNKKTKELTWPVIYFFSYNFLNESINAWHGLSPYTRKRTRRTISPFYLFSL